MIRFPAFPFCEKCTQHDRTLAPPQTPLTPLLCTCLPVYLLFQGILTASCTADPQLGTIVFAELAHVYKLHAGALRGRMCPRLRESLRAFLGLEAS